MRQVKLHVFKIKNKLLYIANSELILIMISPAKIMSFSHELKYSNIKNLFKEN